MGVSDLEPEPDPGRDRRPDSTTYPPEPWALTGHALVGFFALRPSEAPAPHARDLRAWRVGGRVLVGAAFFVYTEPSPLTYHEVMATQVVRDGLVPRVSITEIWVDSPASLAGGRALWSIPKDLASFVVPHEGDYDATGIGRARVTDVRRLTGRPPVRFTVAQQGPEGTQVSPVRGRARVGLARAAWTFDADGPLGYLAGRRPVVSAVLRPFELTFGRTS